MSAHLGFTFPMVGFTRSARTPPPVLADGPLMREFQSDAQFWLPDNPHETFWGRLHYVPGDATRITINGLLGGDLSRYSSLAFPEVHGKLFNGAPIVAKDVWGYAESFIAKEERFRTQLYTRLFLFGMDPTTSSDDRFTRLSLQFSHLNEWFKRPLRVDFQHESFDECLVTFDPAKVAARAAFADEAFSLELFCARKIPSGADAQGVKFTFDYKVVIVPDHPQPLVWHMSTAALVREFLMFLVGSGIYTMEAVAFPGPRPQDGEVHLFPSVAVPLVVRIDPKYFYSRYADIEPHFEKVFSAWFREADRIEVVRHTLLDLLTVDGFSPEAVFTRIVQTMEHLHGIVDPDRNTYVSRALWRKFATWMKREFPQCWSEGLPGEYEELKKVPLGDRIGNLNTYTFRSRIRALFDAVPLRELMPVLGNPREASSYMDTLIPRIEATRNYLTHFSAKQRKLAFPLGELEDPALQCWSVLIFTMARFLGLDDNLAGDFALAARKTMFLVGSRTPL